MQILAAPSRALLGCAHAGQNVLLNQAIALIVLRAQPAQQRRKINATFAQFAVDAMTHAGEVIPLLGPRAPRNLRLDILQMDVPDAVFEAIESRDQVAILSPSAVVIVAGVKHESKSLRIGQLKQGCNLFRRLHITCAVVMEDCPQARFVEDSARNLIGSAGKCLPLRRAESVL